MKNKLYLLVSLLTIIGRSASAQLFTKIITGPVVTTIGDSRSVNFVDVNNDGWDDLFISNGPESGDKNFLYLNNGSGTLTSVVSDDIVTTNAPFDGGTFGDCDNDGDADAYVVTWWGVKNHFYRNNGDGSFTEDISAAPALPNTFSETASWADYDNDGWLDLYVSNSEGDFKNLLYHNKGDGSFEKITSGSIVTDASTSRGVTWIDFDLDGDEDIYVANESSEPNDFYQNNGNGSFTKITSGPHVNDTRSTMSASWGDIDNDGDPDLYTANSGNFVGAKNQLYINNGDGTFTEITSGDAVSDLGCSFSSSFEDYDNDGDLDLAVSNGFCNGSILDFLYLNDGSGNFTRDLSSITDLSTPCSYGCAFGDVNNDGFPDLVFATCNNNSGPDQVDLFYINNGNGNHWIKIRLEGTESNRSAIGTKVKVKAIINGNTVWQYREVMAQSGYCSQNSMTQHFGLGNATVVDSMIIIFPSGNDTVITNITADQVLFVKENSVTGIDDPTDFATLKCFPNPTQNSFMLEMNSKSAGEVKFRLLTTTGVLIEEKFFQVTPGINRFLWDFSDEKYTTGFHFLEAIGNEKKLQIKMLIE